MKIFRAYCESKFCHSSRRGFPSFILTEDSDVLEKYSDIISDTTNIRSEMMSIISVFEHVNIYASENRDIVYVHTTLKMVVDAFQNKWISKWIASGWMNSSKKKVENRDLWERIIEFQSKYDIIFQHTSTNDLALMKKANKLSIKELRSVQKISQVEGDHSKKSKKY